jgi:hypothetical protein
MDSANLTDFVLTVFGSELFMPTYEEIHNEIENMNIEEWEYVRKNRFYSENDLLFLMNHLLSLLEKYEKEKFPKICLTYGINNKETFFKSELIIDAIEGSFQSFIDGDV